MAEFLTDAILDALIDSLKILPFLFLTYVILEYLESHAEDRIHHIIKKAGWMGPFWGSILGVVPQCGFSAAASNLYAGRTITLGTLVAIFLSTSDEMLPIMLSERVPALSMIGILLIKVFLGIAYGFIIDAVCHLVASRSTGQADDGKEFLIERLCEKEHCHCESGSIIVSALKHTANIIGFVFAATVLMNLLFLFLGEEKILQIISNRPISGLFLCSLIGLIPNCGVSVLLTHMYLHGILPLSYLLAGLLDGAGVGLLVLFRVNPGYRENLRITVLLFAISFLSGLLLYSTGFTI